MVRPYNGHFRTNDIISLAEIHDSIANREYESQKLSKSGNVAKMEELLDKTSTANVENKLMEMVNKSGIAVVGEQQPEKEEYVTRVITCVSSYVFVYYYPFLIAHVGVLSNLALSSKLTQQFILQFSRGPAFINTDKEYQIFINISLILCLYEMAFICSTYTLH